MSGITNYSQNQLQYFYKRVAKASGASGTDIITWAASGVMASGVSGISSTSYVSGASNVSGASGFTVEEVDFNEVVELFTEGNLTVGEIEKWLNTNNIEFQFTDNGKIVNFKFTYNNKLYDISCSKKAAESQLDNITQNTFYKSQIDGLRGKYELTDEEISKYFLVGCSYDGNVSKYIINPECGCNTWNEVVNAIKAEKETSRSSSTRKVIQSSQNNEEVETFFNSVKDRTFSSIDEFKNVCGDLVNRLDIEQVYANGDSKYYKVTLKGTNQGISITVNPAESAKAKLQRIEQFFKSVNNETFSSLDEFKAACGDLVNELNIEQVYSNGDYTYYKVNLNGLSSMETNIKVAKEHKVSENTLTDNKTYSLDDLKNIYKLNKNQISKFFDFKGYIESGSVYHNDGSADVIKKEGDYFTLKEGVVVNGKTINSIDELIAAIEESKNAIDDLINKVSKDNIYNKAINVDDVYEQLSGFDDILKETLQLNGCSDEYIDKILDLAKEFVKNQISGNGNLQEIIQKYLDNIWQLSNTSNLTYEIEETGEYIWDRNTGQLVVETKTVNIFENGFDLSDMYIYYQDFYKSDDIVINFLGEIFKNVIENFGLTEDEFSAFINNIEKNIANNNGIDSEYNNCRNTKDLEKLNEKYGTWFDELYRAIQEEAGKIKVVDRNATTVNIDIMFAEKDELTAEDLINNLNQMDLSDDGGVRKFYNLLKQITSKVRTPDIYDEIDLFNCFINLLNKIAGVDVTKSLTKETIEKLNQDNIFEKIEDIINSPELIELYYIGIDGEIDQFGQGGTGDCVLLATIISITSSKYGRDALRDVVQTVVNEKGETVIRVKFKGVTTTGEDISYDITYEEMVEARESHAYSTGDNDVLAIELAIEKYMRHIYLEQDGNFFELGYNGGSAYYQGEDNEEYYNKPGEAIDGLRDDIMGYLLTGYRGIGYYLGFDYGISDDTCMDRYRYISTILENSYDEFKKGNIVFNFGCWKSSEGDETIVDVNGETIGLVFIHEYAIVDMYIDESDSSNNTVTIVNPWYSDKQYTISWAEFCKIDISPLYQQYTHLDNNIIQSELDKMINNFTQGSMDELEFKQALKAFGIDATNNICRANDKDYYFEFDYKGHHYKVSCSRLVADNLYNTQTTYTMDDLLQYTNNMNIINEYFDAAGTKDGEPYIYRLKDGVTLGDFIRIANPSLLAEYKQQEANTYIKTIDTSILGDNEQEFLTEVNKLIDKYSSGKITFAQFKQQVQGLYSLFKCETSKEQFIMLFTGFLNPFNSKETEYYNMFIYNYDNLESFTMTPIQVNGNGYYYSSNQVSQGLFNNLYSTVKALINDIPYGNEVLNKIGGDARLKQILMNIWNDYADGNPMDIQMLFSYLFDDVFGHYSDLEYYLDSTF